MRFAVVAAMLVLAATAVAEAQQDRPPPPRPGEDRPPPPPPGGPHGGAPAPVRTIATAGSVEILAEVWADNWFAFSLGDVPIAEDSVPITTERSFNAERFVFRADYPLTLNFVVKDFRQDDTGLEYIGTGRQQMGDGGFIAQFTDVATGRVIAATNADWRCLVTHEAPLDPACARTANPVPGVGPCGFTIRQEPAGWRLPGFDASSWDHAHEYSAAEVRPKDGYDQIRWAPEAALIWGPDLHTDNTLLCRMTVNP